LSALQRLSLTTSSSTMKLQLQVAAIMAVALFSANTADAAAGDCAVASLATIMAMGDCMAAAGDETAQAACSDGLADACKTCLEAAGENPMSCFAAGAAGDCAGADLTAMTTKDTCEMAAGDETEAAACEAAMVAAVSAKCMVCVAQKDAAAEGNPDHFACFAAGVAGDCVAADLTAMTTKDTCEAAAGDDADEVAACEATMVAAVSAKCMVCVGQKDAAGEEPSACFDTATATTVCCKEGGGLDDADKVGASVECLTAAVAVLDAADLEPPEADCGAGVPNPATITAACKAWIKPNILGAGKECPAPPALGTSAPTSSVSFAASVALVLVALRLH